MYKCCFIFLCLEDTPTQLPFKICDLADDYHNQNTGGPNRLSGCPLWSAALNPHPRPSEKTSPSMGFGFWVGISRSDSHEMLVALEISLVKSGWRRIFWSIFFDHVYTRELGKQTKRLVEHFWTHVQYITWFNHLENGLKVSCFSSFENGSSMIFCFENGVPLKHVSSQFEHVWTLRTPEFCWKIYGFRNVQKVPSRDDITELRKTAPRWIHWSEDGVMVPKYSCLKHV